MAQHYALLSGKGGARRSLALFLYLVEFEEDLKLGECAAGTFPSGGLQVSQFIDTGLMIALTIQIMLEHAPCSQHWVRVPHHQ